MVEAILGNMNSEVILAGMVLVYILGSLTYLVYVALNK